MLSPHQVTPSKPSLSGNGSLGLVGESGHFWRGRPFHPLLWTKSVRTTLKPWQPLAIYRGILLLGFRWCKMEFVLAGILLPGFPMDVHAKAEARRSCALPRCRARTPRRRPKAGSVWGSVWGAGKQALVVLFMDLDLDLDLKKAEFQNGAGPGKWKHGNQNLRFAPPIVSF